MTEIEKLIAERDELSKKIKELKRIQKDVGAYSYGLAKVVKRSKRDLEIYHHKGKYAVHVKDVYKLRHYKDKNIEKISFLTQADTLSELYENVKQIYESLNGIMSFLKEAAEDETL